MVCLFFIKFQFFLQNFHFLLQVLWIYCTQWSHSIIRNRADRHVSRAFLALQTRLVCARSDDSRRRRATIRSGMHMSLSLFDICVSLWHMYVFFVVVADSNQSDAGRRLCDSRERRRRPRVCHAARAHLLLHCVSVATAQLYHTVWRVVSRRDFVARGHRQITIATRRYCFFLCQFCCCCIYVDICV